ncbi:MAG: hypothetical protein BGN96_00905, partial [Bacteroidales bacterium 45-6]
MKKILFIISAVCITLAAQSQIQKAEIQAGGLTCSMCSKSISTALKNIIFIASVETDINNNLFSVTFKPGIQPDFDLVKKKVEDAGFSVAGFWIYARFNQQQVTNDTHLNMNGLNLHFLHVKQQELNGEKKIQLVDKDFVPGKKYKSLAAFTAMECFKTGMMTSCCQKTN